MHSDHERESIEVKDTSTKWLRTRMRSLVRRFGFDLVRYNKADAEKNNRPFPVDFSGEDKAIILAVKPFTMTSKERLFGLMQAVQYLVVHNIPGAIVECGVWRGGSIMAAIKTLQKLNVSDREIYLFDTFEGMPAPEDHDIDYNGLVAGVRFEESRTNTAHSDWCYASIEDVKLNVYATGYDPSKIHFIKGKVEDTIPAYAPDTIALLRLDTDWYSSTHYELTHLYPRLSQKGVLMIDDYGHWQGSRKAVDEYIADNNLSILLNRLDYTGRIAIKT